MLQRVKDYIEANVPDAKVVYGDTDSVFVHILNSTLTSFDNDALAEKITTQLFK